MSEQLPIFSLPVSYYRDTLRVSYEYGVELLERGILQPDARLDGGQPLSSTLPARVALAKRRIQQHRLNTLRARHNLAPQPCPTL